MKLEIERKFLVKADFKAPGTGGLKIVQGYLSRDPQRTVRVHLAGNKVFFNH